MELKDWLEAEKKQAEREECRRDIIIYACLIWAAIANTIALLFK
jgi:hypothetical protein